MATHYETLGVSESASDKEIKTAYKKLAKKHHPDVNNGNDEQFKKVNEAYDNIKTTEKRQMYDAQRKFGPNVHINTGNSPFGFSDIFEEFFGGGFESSSRKRRPSRGSDLRYNMSISLQEAFTGKKTQIRIPSYVACDLCAATGSADKSGPSICSSCNGHGKVRSTSGFFSIERPCPTCGGEGSSINNPCLKCSGTGQVKKQKTNKYYESL